MNRQTESVAVPGTDIAGRGHIQNPMHGDSVLLILCFQSYVHSYSVLLVFLHGCLSLVVQTVGAEGVMPERDSGTTATAPAGAQPLSGPASGGPAAGPPQGEHLLRMPCTVVSTPLLTLALTGFLGACRGLPADHLIGQHCPHHLLVDTCFHCCCARVVFYVLSR